MSKATPRLGRGLSALIGPRPRSTLKRDVPESTSTAKPTPETAEQRGTAIRELPLDKIIPNPRQPRLDIDQTGLDRLAGSLSETGVLQPILVRDSGQAGFELVAGERRWRAASMAGMKTIPAIVRELSDGESFELALIENLQREDLRPLERAFAYQQLIDTMDMSVDEVARRMSESRANVVNYLRLLKLSDEIRDMISAGELAMGQARAIAGIDNPQRQLALARLAVRRNLSVRQVEILAKRDDTPTSVSSEPRRAADAHISDVEQSFTKALGLPVRLQQGRKKNSGRVIIRYNSLEEFDRLAERIAGGSVTE